MDEGEIRECPSNKVKLGYWKSFRLFYSYKRSFSNVDFYRLVEALASILIAVVYLPLLPVLPFIQCWFDLKSAKAQVKANQGRKVKW